MRRIGGEPNDITDQMLDTCYQRMCAWVRLATVAVETEWPEFEALRAFSIFDMDTRPSQETMAENLGKLATTFAPNATQIGQQQQS